jgi:integrase
MNPRRDGQLIPRGDRKFLVRVYLHRDAQGKRVYRSQTVNGTVSEARRVLASMQTKADSGAIVASTRETVRDYLAWWLEACHKPTVAESTYRTTEQRIRLYVLPHVGHYLLQKLTPSIVQGTYAALNQQVEAQMVVHAHRALSQALRKAVKLGRISRNPCDDADLPRVARVEMRTLTPAQVYLFLDGTADHNLSALWHLLFLAGLRPSEALALRWSDIVDGSVRIQRTLRHGTGNHWYLDEPKTQKSRRTVPLTEATLHALAKRQRASGGIGEASVFDSPMSTVSHAYKAALARLELPSIRLYDTRHTHATLLLGAGENLKVVSERLGHSTIALTGNTYAHVTPTMQAESVLRLEKVMKKAANT